MTPSLMKKMFAPVHSATRGPSSRASARRRSLRAPPCAWRSCRSCRGRRPWRAPGRARIRTAVFRHSDADALHPLRRVEIARPFPGRDREVDRVALGRHAHHLRAAPDDRADIGVGLLVGLQRRFFSPCRSPRPCRAPSCRGSRRPDQPLGILAALEDLAAIGPLALEHGRAVMHRMRQHVDARVVSRMSLPSIQMKPSRWSKEGPAMSHSRIGGRRARRQRGRSIDW